MNLPERPLEPPSPKLPIADVCSICKDDIPTGEEYWQFGKFTVCKYCMKFHKKEG